MNPAAGETSAAARGAASTAPELFVQAVVQFLGIA